MHVDFVLSNVQVPVAPLRVSCREVLYLSDQLVAEAATNTIQNKHTRQIPSAAFFYSRFLFLPFVLFFLSIVYFISSVLASLTLLQRTTQISMPPTGFKPVITASQWPQTYALENAATDISTNLLFRLPQAPINNISYRLCSHVSGVKQKVLHIHYRWFRFK
jgi:hypothetical protein